MKYKKYVIKVKETMVKMIKLSKEREEMIKTLTENCTESERIMKSCRDVEAVDIKYVRTQAVEKWFHAATEKYEGKFHAATEKYEGKELKINALHKKFELMDENKKHRITLDDFKTILKEILPKEKLIFSKGKKTQDTILGVLGFRFIK